MSIRVTLWNRKPEHVDANEPSLKDENAGTGPAESLAWPSPTSNVILTGVVDPQLQRTVEPAELKSRKHCHCTRSQCLKLYCECFAKGLMCISCPCSNCHNNSQHDMSRQKAIKSYLGRVPGVFRSKTAGGISGEVRGCHCKRSGCLKNYCECFEAMTKCSSTCKCVGCRNYATGPQINLNEATVSDKDEGFKSVITLTEVETVCDCLLAKAEAAEMENQSSAHAECSVLDTFGYCLSLIVQAMDTKF